MKKLILLLSLNLLFIIFQNSFFMEFFGNSANPNFILSLTFAFLLLNMDEAALLNALIGGLLIDLFGVGIIGQHTVTLVLLTTLVRSFRAYISKNTSIAVVLLLIFTLILKQSISLTVFYAAILNIVLMFSFVLFIKKVTKKFLSTTYRIRA